MTTSNSLIDVGKLAEPINTLVTKIADAIGVVYEPKRIIRKANAEAKANEIMAISQLNIQDIQQRALVRFVHEETQKQENIENIIESALPQISNDAKTEDVSLDWIVKFFEHAKLISDKEMQELWGRILGGESNAPGTFTKKTLNIVAELEKDDALLFSNLCKFAFFNIGPLVYNSEDEIYNKYGLNFISLHHLEDLGLIKFDKVGGFRLVNQKKNIQLTYYDKKILIGFEKDEGNDFSMGSVMLSKEGRQLISICSITPEEEILEYIVNKIKSKGATVEVVDETE